MRNIMRLSPVMAILPVMIVIFLGSCNAKNTGEIQDTSNITTSPVSMIPTTNTGTITPSVSATTQTGTTAPVSTSPSSTTQEIKDISVAEANASIQANADNPDFIIIDVRTADEYATGHLENAINIDLYSENFNAEIGKLDRNKIYLIYCRTGVRSSGARDVMKALGFMNINNMLDSKNNKGGITAWMEQGFPVVK